MNTLIAIVFAAALIAATILVHYEALRVISDFVPSRMALPRRGILIVIGGVFVAHLFAISLYAVAFYLLHTHLSVGSIDGQFSGAALDFFYFSITSYTTLGVGDLFPHGPLRIVAGVESLNGFVLIGWSASFTYLAMERLWQEQRRSPQRQ